MSRRLLLQAILVASLDVHLAAGAATPVIDVYKNAWCECCSDWVKHLQAGGFTVKAHDVSSPTDYREKFGMPLALDSCQTARAQGYIIEGHVPAVEIKRLLAERPKAKGLASPSMPLGSPGMEGPLSGPDDVPLVQVDGHYSIYRHYSAK